MKTEQEIRQEAVEEYKRWLLEEIIKRDYGLSIRRFVESYTLPNK